MPKLAFLTLLFFSTTTLGQESQDNFSNQLNKIITAVRTDLKIVRGRMKEVTNTDTTYFSKVTLSGSTDNEVHYLTESTNCASCFSFSATIACPVVSDVAKATVQVWKEKISAALGNNVSPEEYRDEDESSMNDGYKLRVQGIDVLVYSVKLSNADTLCVYLTILKSI